MAGRQPVFISHANPEDSEFASWLRTRLRAAGYDVWADVFRPVGGEAFWRDIGQAIKEDAAIIIVALSRNSYCKDGMLDEIALAAGTGRKRHKASFVTPEGDENRRACDWRLPGQLAPHLRRFVADHRPAFKGAETHRELWPSILGKPLLSSRIASLFGQLTEQLLGVRLSPHCVRYAAATSAALASSACANTIPLLLGHADPRTASAYYNLATTTQAQRLTTSTLQEIHAELRDKIGKRR